MKITLAMIILLLYLFIIDRYISKQKHIVCMTVWNRYKYYYYVKLYDSWNLSLKWLNCCVFIGLVNKSFILSGPLVIILVNKNEPVNLPGLPTTLDYNDKYIIYSTTIIYI